MKFRLSTVLMAFTSLVLAIGWLLERRSYEVYFQDRLENQLFAVSDIDAELTGSYKVNSFAVMISALENGGMSKERFEERRTIRLLDNVLNLYRVDQILRKTKFQFEGAEKFVSTRARELRFQTGESLYYLDVNTVTQLTARLRSKKSAIERLDLEVLTVDDECVDSLKKFVEESLKRFSQFSSEHE